MRYMLLPFVSTVALLMGGCNGDTSEETGTPCGSGCDNEAVADVTITKAEGVEVEMTSDCCTATCTDEGNSATCTVTETDTYTVVGSIPNGECLEESVVVVVDDEPDNVQLTCALLPNGVYHLEETCEVYNIVTKATETEYVMTGLLFSVPINGNSFNKTASGVTLRGLISDDLTTITYEGLYEGEITTSGTLIKNGTENNDCD